MTDFCHLHGHSTFSFLDGYGTPEQIAQRIKELGHSSCAITDHGNVFAHVPWQKACRNAGIKPIFGCEFYVCDDMTARTRELRQGMGQGLPHATVLAATQKGYENLLKLSRLSWEEGFYYKPRLDWPTIGRHQEGLIVLSGCVGGYPSRLITGVDVEAAWSFVCTVRKWIEQYYIEAIPEPGLNISHATFEPLFRVANDLRIPVVMTGDAHFPRREDHDAQDLMLAVGMNEKIGGERKLQLPEYQFYCSRDELLARAQGVWSGAPPAWYAQAIDNAGLIAASCNVEIPKAKPIAFPKIPEGSSAADELWRVVCEGATRRIEAGQIPAGQSQDYFARAAREFDTIKRKGFCDYLLAIGDVVHWMKEQGGLVMLRGSAGGCLMLWLMGASETDPILHALSFERFYDDTRPDPPDVDIDFEKGKRDEAIAYIYATYGADRCAQIAALSQIKAKAALQDAASAFGIHRSEFAPLSNALESRDEDVAGQLEAVTDPAALAVFARHPELKIIERLIGQYRQSSIHACGVLVSSEPLDKVIGVVLGKDKQVVASVDKEGAKELGLLKMDFLSVTGLDIVAAAVRKLGKPMSWLTTIPLDDCASLKLADEGFLAGVFQLNGGSAARVCREIGLNTFEDIVVASALCRPGPAEWASTYRQNKTRPAVFEDYLAQMHPAAANVVRRTYGILLYQEQVMQIAREMAGLEWKDVHKLRKGVCDKIGFDPQKGPAWNEEWHEKFVGGCIKNGVPQAEAEFWWTSIKSHGGYSFNRSHCVTYGIIGYWMLYLKAHYPTAFYEAFLQIEQDPITTKRLVREFEHIGGDVRLLDPVFLGMSFRACGDHALTGGLTDIKGIGPKIAEKIIAQGPFMGWTHLYSALPKGIAAKFREAGIGQQCPQCLAADETCDLCGGTGLAFDTQRVVMLAPWYPVQITSPTEAALRKQYAVAHLGCLKMGVPSDDDVFVAGYVTFTNFEKDRLIAIVEDEHCTVATKVPARLAKQLGPKFRGLLVSDYVAVRGWWAGDVLYAKDFAIMKRREELVKA
jgi:DNA polymerase-3 subunit alpha